MHTLGSGLAPAAVLLALALVSCGAPASVPSSQPSSQPPSSAHGPAAVPPTEEAVDREVGTVVFLGDSYTAGAGAAPDAGYVAGLAARLDWQVVGLGQGGTGYVSPGRRPGSSPYGERLDEVAAHDPDLVVVQGSTNDAGHEPRTVQGAATRLYEELAARLPDADVVVVGPTLPPALSRADVREVRDALAAAARSRGVPFVDPVSARWLQPPEDFYTRDGVHPSDVGHQRFAEEVLARLDRLGYR